MSSCDLDLWPVDLESSWYIKCHMIKFFTKFEWNRAIPRWIIDNFANFCTRCHAVTWSLTPWPWTFTAFWMKPCKCIFWRFGWFFLFYNGTVRALFSLLVIWWCTTSSYANGSGREWITNGNGNKTRLNMGSGMGIRMNHWEWKGMRL